MNFLLYVRLSYIHESLNSIERAFIMTYYIIYCTFISNFYTTLFQKDCFLYTIDNSVIIFTILLHFITFLRECRYFFRSRYVR